MVGSPPCPTPAARCGGWPEGRFLTAIRTRMETWYLVVQEAMQGYKGLADDQWKLVGWLVDREKLQRRWVAPLGQPEANNDGS